MQNFSYEYCEEKDIIYLSNINCEQLIAEYSLLKEKLKSPDKTSSAQDDGKILKENNSVFLSEVYSAEYSFVSPASRVFENIYKEMKQHSFPVKSTMNYFKAAEGLNNILLSEYRNGDYYKPHRDASSLTMLIWPMPKTFNGGSLVLTDFNHKISCYQNTGLIFPSHYLHEVEEVFYRDEESKRVTYTGFVS